MKQTRIAAAAVLSAALIAPVAVLAATPSPKFTSSYIVPNKSLGGLELGGPASNAIKIFGSRDCSIKTGCSYTAPDQSWSLNVLLAAKTASSKPFIADITLTVAKPSSPSIPDLKTSSGIGFGSSPAALKKAYPTLLGSAQSTFYTNINKLPYTDYHFTNGHLTAISMLAVHLG
jgi:hypothetical protein